jgi:cathepsin L
MCGDSVVFNALDCLSAAVTIQTRRPLEKLSRQQIYDCTQCTKYSKKKQKLINYFFLDPELCSCEGSSANVSNIYYKLIKLFNGDVDSEASYPTTGKCDGICHFTKSGTAAQIEQYVENTSGDEKILHKLLQYGPVTAAIDAGLTSFQIYTSGIYEDPDCKAADVDHVVLIVGYGSEDGNDYWIARNT